MKSVLFINYEYPPTGAGAANATRHFARHFSSQGIRTSVLTSAFGSHRGLSVEDGVTVSRIKACRKYRERSSLFQMICYTVAACLHLGHEITRSRPDMLIVFFSIPCGPVGLYARIRWNIPYVVMLRGGDVPGSDFRLHWHHFLLSPLRRRIYRQSIATIANSEGLRKQALKSDAGFKINVIENGVDTTYFSPGTRHRERTDPFTFIFSGRTCAQKNIDLLITALTRCCASGYNCRLIIAGDGPDMKRLRSLSRTLSIENRISWTGWQTGAQLRDLYRQADCLVNPSRNEGHPNSVLEAMACGLPVIASYCAGNSDIVVEHRSGLFFFTRDVTELQEKMCILVSDRPKAVRMGTKGRELCTTFYSWDSAGSRLLTTLNEAHHASSAV